MACSGCARRRAKIKAAYNRLFKQASPNQTVVAAGGLGKKLTVFDREASGLVNIPEGK